MISVRRMSLWGTMHGNFEGISPFIPPLVRPWWDRQTDEQAFDWKRFSTLGEAASKSNPCEFLYIVVTVICSHITIFTLWGNTAYAVWS